MTLKRIAESATGTKQRLLRVVSAAVVIVVVSAATFGVSSASATLPGGVEKVVGAAGSVVPAVTATPTPSVPGTVPPPPAVPPSPPAAVPDTPQAPAPPSSSPAPPLADSVTKAVGQVADALDDGTAGTTEKTAAAAGGMSKEGVKKTASSARSEGPVTFQGGRGASAPTTEVGSVGNDAPGPRAAPRTLARRGAPPSIGSARPAPLRRWLAYVWPAIALGRNGEALAKGETLPPLTLAGFARLLVMGATRASGSGEPSPSGQAVTPDAPRAAPHDTLVPGGAEITSFVIFSFAALLALLISAAWMEVRSKYLYR